MPALLRGVRLGRADRLPPPDVVHRPLAALEDADPLFGPALPRAHLRRPRERPVRPPPGRIRRARLRGRRPGRDGRHRHRAGSGGVVVDGRAAGADLGGRAPRARRGRRLHRAGRALRRLAEGPRHGRLLGRGARQRRGMGEVQPPLLAARLPGLPRVLLRADVQRAAFDQADRGLRRLGPRDRPRDAHRDPAGRGPRRGRGAPPLQPGALPRARDPGDGGCHHGEAPGRNAGPGHRGRARAVGGIRPRAPRAATRSR